MSGHVLVARLDSDGDVLLTGPAVRAIGSDAARVTMLCSPRAEAAARLLPAIDAIACFEAPWIAAEPPAVEGDAVDALVRTIAAMSIDEAVVFTSFHQSPLPLALLLRLAGVGRIAAISDDYPGSLLDVRHRVVDDVHEVVRNLSLAAAAGHDRRDDGRLRVVGDPAARPGGLPDDYVVVHPGASVASRRWRPDGFAEVVALLVARGRDVVVTGSAAEAGLAAAVCTTTPALDLAGRTSAAGLAEVLRGASVVVVGNTGPAHLAAAVGTPVVSLFAATVPVTRWRPWGVAHEVLGHQDIGCSGCRARSCPLPEQSCLSSVTAADVVAAVDRLSAGVLVA